MHSTFGSCIKQGYSCRQAKLYASVNTKMHLKFRGESLLTLPSILKQISLELHDFRLLIHGHTLSINNYFNAKAHTDAKKKCETHMHSGPRTSSAARVTTPPRLRADIAKHAFCDAGCGCCTPAAHRARRWAGCCEQLVEAKPVGSARSILF